MRFRSHYAAADCNLLPSFEGATEWLGEPFAPNAFRPRPLLVQFWAMSCPVCKINMPGVLSFLETYCQEGLQLVSIHMPRFEADTDVEAVRAVAAELSLSGPCAVDNDHTISDLFHTGSIWPRYFFFDAEGKLRSRAAGSLGLRMAENSLKRLLATEPSSS